MPHSQQGPRIDEEAQFLARLAWACEIEGLTQAAAAERFGVTRLRVNKALAEARDRGIVRVAIESPFAPCAELEWALCKRFGLKVASVAPAAEPGADPSALVGNSLGNHLSRILAEPDIKRFGMSWGNTLNMATRFMHSVPRPDLEIVSVMGGIVKGSELNSFEITTRLASLCGARRSYFTAPLYAGSPESRRVLVAQDVFRSMISKIRSADSLALGAGSMVGSLLVQDGLPAEYSVRELCEQGAVGDVLGYILDSEGNLIDHPINRRVVGIELSDLNSVPNVILAAGGRRKLPILRAILKRGCINALVTDETTAADLASG